MGDPNDCYLLLQTPNGPSLWRHNVLLFGAVASVWGCNRFGDVLCHLQRTLFWSPTLHYVDDYGSVEPADTADSGFTALGELNHKIGTMVKTSKQQPRATTHRIQGVELTLTYDHCIAAPTTSRVSEMVRQIDQCLATNHLDHSEAAHMAGKLGFLSTTSWAEHPPRRCSADNTAPGGTPSSPSHCSLR